MRDAGWGAGLVLAVGLLAVGLAGCQTVDEGLAGASIWAPSPESPAPPPLAPTLTVQNPDDVKYYPSDEPLRMGVEHFRPGNYGIADHYFRDATEKAHKAPAPSLRPPPTHHPLTPLPLPARPHPH